MQSSLFLKLNTLSCIIILIRLSKQNPVAAEYQEVSAEIEKGMMKRKAQLHEIEQTLPKENGLYLKVS